MVGRVSFGHRVRVHPAWVLHTSGSAQTKYVHAPIAGAIQTILLRSRLARAMMLNQSGRKGAGVRSSAESTRCVPPASSRPGAGATSLDLCSRKQRDATGGQGRAKRGGGEEAL